jgi:hypothetical protein
MMKDIIKKILKEHPDANLNSDAACEEIAKRIAEAIGDWDLIGSD